MKTWHTVLVLTLVLAGVVCMMLFLPSPDNGSLASSLQLDPPDRSVFLEGYLTTDLVRHNWVDPSAEVVRMCPGQYEAYLTVTDPAGKFVGMRFRITVNYEEGGQPMVFGGFEY